MAVACGGVVASAVGGSQCAGQGQRGGPGGSRGASAYGHPAGTAGAGGSAACGSAVYTGGREAPNGRSGTSDE